MIPFMLAIEVLLFFRVVAVLQIGDAALPEGITQSLGSIILEFPEQKVERWSITTGRIAGCVAD